MGEQEKEIYFHVGLGKTASTYLQQAFFPRLQGIHYIPTRRYRSSPAIIPQLKANKILVSREFDHQLDTECAWFSGYYPRAKPIIFLRRHDRWIASQYRRFVKNGSSDTFAAFLDLEKDAGFWPQREMIFMDKIRSLEQYFGSRPLVLFHEDLRANGPAVLRRLADFMGADFDPEQVSRRPVHRSYSDKQLKILRKWGRGWLSDYPEFSDNKALNWIQKRSRLLLSYAILYPARFFPDSWAGPDPLIPAGQLEAVRLFFQADWEQCRAYAAGQPVP